MKILITILVLILSFTAQAMTSGQFIGPYGIIRVVPQNLSGESDLDGKVLYEAMNVPVKDSMIGPGKAIETADGALQFICALRQQAGPECSIFIHQKGHGIVNSATKTMIYKVQGDEADVYVKLFKTDVNGEFNFVSVDRLLKIQIAPGFFEVRFQQLALNSDKGLVVINVEDTLKIAHIQNFWDSLNYNTNTKKRFLGMVEALRLLARSNPSYRFVYLTRPQELVAGKIEREFISNNKFPLGEFRNYSMDPMVKTRAEILRNLLTEYPVKNVVFMGHNGGPDPDVFSLISKEFININFHQYIHTVYSTSGAMALGRELYSEQTGFLTAVELIVDWQQRGLTGMDSLKLVKSLISKVLSEASDQTHLDEIAIPSFVNCDAFRWRWPVEGDFVVLAPVRKHLLDRCYVQEPLAGF